MAADNLFFDFVCKAWTTKRSARSICKDRSTLIFVMQHLQNEKAVDALFALHKTRGRLVQSVVFEHMPEICTAFLTHTDESVRRQLFAVMVHSRTTRGAHCTIADDLLAVNAILWLANSQGDQADREFAVKFLHVLYPCSVRRALDDVLINIFCEAFASDWTYRPLWALVYTLCQDRRTLQRIGGRVADRMYFAFLDDYAKMEHLHTFIVQARHYAHYRYDDRLVDLIVTTRANTQSNACATATSLLSHTLGTAREAKAMLIKHPRFGELQEQLREVLQTAGPLHNRSASLVLQMLWCRSALPPKTVEAMRSYVRLHPRTFTFPSSLNGTADIPTLEHVISIGRLLSVPDATLRSYHTELDELKQREAIKKRFDGLGASMDAVETPTAFKCPVTLDVMRDPTVASDGHSYERSTLLRLLKTRQKSPMTREPLDRAVAVPNINLKKRIREYLGDVCTAVESVEKKRRPVTASTGSESCTSDAPDRP